jgi:predicted N-acetyltransferase YhbS
MGVLIRELRVDDADAIQRIAKAISKDGSDVDLKKSIDHMTRNSANQNSLVAEDNGKVVGYMISNVLYAGFGLKKSAWIVSMGVDPEHMGQGIGKRLAKDLFEVYREKGVSHIYSSVLWDSIDLLSFFKTLGFERSAFINLRKEL